MDNHNEQNAHSTRKYELWKKIGKQNQSIKDSPQDLFGETSIEIDLYKTQYQLSKSRTLITKDYINNTSLAHSGYIESPQKYQKLQEDQEKATDLKKFHPQIKLTKKGTNKQQNLKLMELSMQIQQLKFKYNNFACDLMRKLEQFFNILTEFLVKGIKSASVKKINTKKLQVENMLLKKQCISLTQKLQDKTGKIYSLQKQIKIMKQAISLHQNSKNNQMHHKLTSSGKYWNELNEKRQHKLQNLIRSTKIYPTTHYSHQFQYKQEDRETANRKFRSTDKEDTKQKISKHNERKSNKMRIKNAQLQQEESDFKEIRRKLDNLKFQIQRIS